MLDLIGPHRMDIIRVAVSIDCHQQSECRAYLAVYKANGQESSLLLPSVVLTLNAIYQGILAAVQQVRPFCQVALANHRPVQSWLESIGTAPPGSMR